MPDTQMKPCKLIAFGIVFLALAGPALGDTCSAGNLSGFMGTTCDVGNLQFTFTSFFSINSAGAPWSPSNFTLTPITDGFTLSFDGGPQSITAPPGGIADEQAALNYTVSITDPLNEHITGMGVIGGGVLASGSTHSDAVSIGSTCDVLLCPEIGLGAGNFAAGNETFQAGGFLSNDSITFAPAPGAGLDSGFANASPFGLHAENGDSASWDGAPFTFSYTTAPGQIPLPEPSSLLLLNIALIFFGSLALLRQKRPAQREHSG